MKIGKLFLIPCSISEAPPQPFLSPQILATVRDLRYYLVENPRSARRFISSLKADVTIDDLNLELLDKSTTFEELNQKLAPLLLGHDIGIVSESGCPGIADPGSLAAKWAHSHSIEVIPLVGPSSILLTLMGSGMSGQQFCFHGYLPIEEKERQKAIRKLEEESIRNNQTQLFIETPYRNDKMWETLVQTCRKDTLLCVGRDLTGPKQMLLTKTIGEWKQQKPELNKLPVVFALYSRVFR